MKKTLELAFAHAVARMLVDCVRVIHGDAYSQKHIGASLEEMFVSFAVHIGTAEDRPMSATKIAGFLGIPRTNVLRALAALKKKDIIYSIGNVYLTNVDRLAKRITPLLMKKQTKTIARTYVELTKLKSSILVE
jgi:Crp-like helix-turn-helix protein